MKVSEQNKSPKKLEYRSEKTAPAGGGHKMWKLSPKDQLTEDLFPIQNDPRIIGNKLNKPGNDPYELEDPTSSSAYEE